MKILGKAKNWLKKNGKAHLIDSTSLLAEGLPVFAAMEVGLIEMPNQMSLNAKLFGTLTTYFGVGSAFTRGRAFSRKMFGIKDKTSELIQPVHDTIYAGIFHLIVLPPTYLISGERDLRNLAMGSLVGAGLAAANGYFAGIATDVGKDLTGLRECNRRLYPDLIKRQKPWIKKGLAATLCATSVAAVLGIYELNTYLRNNKGNQQTQQNNLEANLK